MTFASRPARPLTSVAAALALIAAGTAGAISLAPTAFAQTAAAKAVVDAAKAKGQIGEQGDGYLGVVAAPPPADVAAALAEINTGRAAAYHDIAAKTGATPEAAGQATALKLFAKLPPGQFYKPLGGAWTKN